jgi:hypothetical protein
MEQRNITLGASDPDARNVVELLDGMPGAFERAALGLRQTISNETVPLDQLCTTGPRRS